MLRTLRALGKISKWADPPPSATFQIGKDGSRNLHGSLANFFKMLKKRALSLGTYARSARLRRDAFTHRAKPPSGRRRKTAKTAARCPSVLFRTRGRPYLVHSTAESRMAGTARRQKRPKRRFGHKTASRPKRGSDRIPSPCTSGMPHAPGESAPTRWHRRQRMGHGTGARKAGQRMNVTFEHVTERVTLI